MKFLYVIPIIIGFSIDSLWFGGWMIAYLKRNRPQLNPTAISIFVLPAWGISGLMIFGKQPREMMEVWNCFLLVLFLAFCLHLFICIILPYLCIIVCNLYYSRELLDTSPLPQHRRCYGRKKEVVPAVVENGSSVRVVCESYATAC